MSDFDDDEEENDMFVYFKRTASTVPFYYSSTGRWSIYIYIPILYEYSSIYSIFLSKYAVDKHFVQDFKIPVLVPECTSRVVIGVADFYYRYDNKSCTPEYNIGMYRY